MDTTSIVTKEKGWIGTAYVARFDFNTKKDEEILVTTGISGVSMEGAGKNLRAEAPKDDSITIKRRLARIGTDSFPRLR